MDWRVLLRPTATDRRRRPWRERLREWLVLRRSAVRWSLRTEARRRAYVARRLAPEPDGWLFVLGLNNSGTTLLTRVLESHPAIRSMPREGQMLTHALPRSREHGCVRVWGTRLDVFHWTEADDPAPALRAMFDWSAWYPRRPGVLLEKSPPNTARARWLQAHFRPCRFIVITRSPYAVCEGIVRRQPECTIERAATHWDRAHATLLDDLPRLDRVLRLTYESFCADPARVLEDVGSFLDLAAPFEAGTSGVVDVHNMTGAPQPITSFNARSLARLSGADVRAINDIAGETMRRLGYESIDPDAHEPAGPTASAT